MTTSAQELAAELLAEQLPVRWSHVQGVGRRARALSGDEVLETAAWLHDIGYSPQLVDTGFHPLDGARYLRRLGVDERVVCLVAHHTCALVEAEERGLADVLAAEFAREESITADLLWYCDLTVGPRGQQVTVAERIKEILARYGPEHLVTRSIGRARPALVAAARRAEAFLAARGGAARPE